MEPGLDLPHELILVAQRLEEQVVVVLLVVVQIVFVVLVVHLHVDLDV